MVIVVVVINTLISLGCFYAAWQIWKIRSVLANAADTLTNIEQSTNNGLSHAPQAISTAQKGTHSLRERYQGFEDKVQQLQQVVTVLSFIQKFLPRRPLKVRYSRPRR